MKILHVLRSNEFSGAENVACQIIKMMENLGYDSAYCSADGSIRETLEAKDIKFFPVKKLTIRGLYKVIKSYKPDVIHAHDMYASLISAMVSGKTKVISHIHNSDFSSRKLSVKSILYLISSIKFSNIIWVSHSCFEFYRFHNILKEKSKILYNVIDGEQVNEKAESDSNEYSYDMVYVGRLAEPKNPLRLINIVKLIKEKKDDIKVGIVGSGNLEAITRAKADEYELNDNVYFHGFMDNPLKIIKSSKVLAITSDREGLPMVALEAMALGVPIVSTPTDGLCDIVKSGVTGFLESEEEKFAESVLLLINNLNIREKFSELTLEEFSEINDIEKYKGVLNGLYCE